MNFPVKAGKGDNQIHLGSCSTLTSQLVRCEPVIFSSHHSSLQSSMKIGASKNRYEFKNYINGYISGHTSDPSSGLTNKNLNKSYVKRGKGLFLDQGSKGCLKTTL